VRDAAVTYRLRGDVRLLLIWLGKDDVGGGRITIKRNGAPAAGSWTEEFEILFGSNPDRVPGEINRWGYGREIAEWRQANGESAPRLTGTIFQGLMRDTYADSIEQARKDTQNAATNRQFSFAATESKVSSAEASSEIRDFTTSEEFDYRKPDLLLSHYQANLASTPATKKGSLINRPPVYELPYGFLTGVSELIRRVTDTPEKQTGKQEPTKPRLTYVYNAKPYRLEVLRIQEDKDFRLPTQPASMRMPRVIRVQLRSFNIVNRTRVDFDLWLPMSGEYKGIPLRIQHQPRWWLRLRLDLDLRNSHTLSASPRNHSTASTH
jgi:hypothetical protein